MSDLPSQDDTQRELIRKALAAPDFGTLLGFFGRDLHLAAVRDTYPDRQYAWPCIRGFEALSFVTPDGEVVIALKDKPLDIVSVTGQLERIAAVRGSDHGHSSLRQDLELRACDAVFKAPLRIVSDDRRAVLGGWTQEDRDVLTAHAKLNIRWNERHLGLNAPRPELNETDLAIAEMVFTQGPLPGKVIVESLPQHLKVSASQVRRIFSKKLVEYGFWNPRNGAGYHAPQSPTWR